MRGLRALLAAGLAGMCVFVAPGAALSQESRVTLAGVAYSGEAASIDQRFPYSRRYEQQLKAAGDSGYERVRGAILKATPRNLQVTTDVVQELKGRDQAIVTALVLNSETVSVERFGDTRKLFILVRGQALFFDFKSMTALRAYPLSFAFIDNLHHEPTEAEIMARVKMVYEGAGGKPGIFGRFADAVAVAKLPAQTPRFLQVKEVTLPPAMVEQLPAYLKEEKTYKSWAADMIAEAISSRIGVPIIPYAKGYAVGKVMSMQVMDGDVYTIELPTPDYEINVEFKGLKKVKYGESGAGASYIYGSFAHMRIWEPTGEKAYLDTQLKNAEVKVVPASQTYVDDFPAFNDSLNAMFVKLADAVAGKGTAWLKTSASAADIEAQVAATQHLMDQCK